MDSNERKEGSPGLMKWIAAAFIGVFAAILWAADQGALPAFVRHLYDFPHGDKVGHFIMMGFLNLSAIVLLPRGKAGGARRIVLISLGVALLAGVEELSQQYFADRTFSLADLLASYAGIASGALLAGAIFRGRQRLE